jgi:hypothetical protein
MNERIRELMAEADRKCSETRGVYDEILAELIVRECIKSLWTEECHTSDLAVEEYNRNSKKIKQHFGIEK